MIQGHVALFWTLALVWCSYIPTILSVKNYAITTLINTKWNQTPLYVEIAEYMTDENTDLFWEFINSLETIEKPLSEYDTDSKQYLAAINVARKHLGELQMSLLKLVVSMHTSTPRIQAHLQSANQLNPDQECAKVFAYIDSSLACTLDELKSKLNDIQDRDQKEIIELYNFDHIYPNTENNSRTVILFGDIGTIEFVQFHKYLSRQSLENNIRYVFRHFFRDGHSQRVRLSSYGVELHLKSTEYKSQDDAPKLAEENESDDNSTDELTVNGFDFKILQSRFPEHSYSLSQFKRTLVNTVEEIPKLKPWEFQDLGLKAAAAITEAPSEKSLQILEHISQNFPMQCRTFVNKNVPESLRLEIQKNIELFGRSLNIAPPDGALFINGYFFDADTIDLGTILETIRIELRVLENLHTIGFHGKIATSLLSIDLSTISNIEFAIDIRDPAILWINDIENDAQYRRWPGSITDLLRPTFPGMLRNIRKNLFNLVLVIDPLKLKCRNLIKLTESFIEHMAPIRLGLVFDASEASESNLSEYQAIISAFNYVSQKIDARSALSFLKDVLAAMEPNEQSLIKYVHSQLKKKFPNLSKSDITSIISTDSDYDSKMQLSQDFVNRLGLASSPQALINGVPIEQKLLCSDSDFEEAVFTGVMQQTSTLQKAVYKGELTDNEDVLNYLMNQPNIMPRLNLRILNESNVNFLDLSGTPYTNINNVHELAKLSNRDMTATLLKHVKYFQLENSAEKIGTSKVHFLTVWVIADLDTTEGKDLLRSALMYVKSDSSIRVAFIPNTEGSKISDPTNLNRVVWALSQVQTDMNIVEIVIDLLKNEKTTQSIKKTIPELKDILPLTELHMKMLRVYAQRVLYLGKSERLVIGNGKIYGPFLKKETFTVEDFKLLDYFNTLKYGEKIRKILKQVAMNDDDEKITMNLNSDTLLKLCVSLISRQTKARFKIPNEVNDLHSALKFEPKDESLPFFAISAIVDPASRGAQKLAPILVLLRKILNCQMTVYLTPTGQHSDMPIKNFYRYVIEPEVHFDINGKLAETKKVARFTSLPVNALLTQNLHIPDNWLVEVVRSVYDLDNIKLDEIGGSVHSEYELEFLLIEGHCFDATNGTPPRGLQIILGQKDNANIVDTIVMANLGYFQLKANPGAWELRLRDGKSSYIYDITNAEGPNTIFMNNTAKIVVSSLRPYVIKLRVEKKLDKQDEDLLGDNDVRTQSSGIWNSIANSFGGSTSDSNEKEDDVINIFSVASGHLYERLLRIMMLSLLKHTKSPVKFWFLKNYLSPQFTEFLPHMAREYNFEFELVQYKWPRWLHQQTEKQRTIWGYKILFLDVLFPLNVRKIIFVDADAIVRTDIKELYDLDLGNSPYAYTPFCDSRNEMEGFRFWKQGYWRSHLMGRRYHISALYVVDLKRFRKVAAGDRLRGQYQALSQDPNSLSNLDQDLPNNMIHQVSIKSLPEEWLWCETWCSDSSFKKAKVIDLCNNPQTKEAKLVAAQRIVPEWKTYDEEIKRLIAKITDNENIDSDSTENVDFSHSKPEEKRSKGKERIEL